MDGPDDTAGVVRTVEEVGVGEREMLGARPDLLLDVGENRVDAHDPDPSVVDDRDRAVPASVGAAPARLDDGDELLGVAAHETRVPVEWRQEVAGRPAGRVGPCEVHDAPVVATLDPGQERGVGLAGEHPVGAVGHRRAVEAEAGHGEVGPTLAHVVDDLPGDPGRGVHRDAAGDPIRPGHQLRIPGLDRQVVTAHVVAGVAQPRGGLGDADGLVAELVTRHQGDTHAAEGTGAGRVGRLDQPMSTSRRAWALRSAASTAAGVAARAKRNPRYRSPSGSVRTSRPRGIVTARPTIPGTARAAG